MGIKLGDNSRTLLITHDPSTLEELARMFDFWGKLVNYNTSESGALADYYALRSDWGAVGDELRRALLQTKQLIANR